MMAGKAGKKDAVKNAVVHAKVHLGEPMYIGGFGIAVDIKVEGVEDDALIQAGHEVRLSPLAIVSRPHQYYTHHYFLQNCPYSRALTHGAVVNVSKAY